MSDKEITREGFITWVDTWISGCSENMCQCSGCLTDKKECQKAYDTFYKLIGKPEKLMTKIEEEEEKIREEQTALVMPMIGGLLDAWDALPNDVKGYEELERLACQIRRIDDAMEGDDAE